MILHFNNFWQGLIRGKTRKTPPLLLIAVYTLYNLIAMAMAFTDHGFHKFSQLSYLQPTYNHKHLFALYHQDYHLCDGVQSHYLAPFFKQSDNRMGKFAQFAGTGIIEANNCALPLPRPFGPQTNSRNEFLMRIGTLNHAFGPLSPKPPGTTIA